jgi:hypothetical protein
MILKGNRWRGFLFFDVWFSLIVLAHILYFRVIAFLAVSLV